MAGKLLENTMVKLLFAISPEQFDASEVILFLVEDESPRREVKKCV